MASDKLYDLMVQYKKTKLWTKLWDNHLFAIQLSDGQVGFISVMGRVGVSCSVCLYVGEKAFASHRYLAINKIQNTNDAYKVLFMVDCLQAFLASKDELIEEELAEANSYSKRHNVTFRGKNGYPQFLKYRPNYMPWPVKDAADDQHMQEALELCIAISDMKKPEDKGIYEITFPTDGDMPLFSPSGELLRRIRVPDTEAAEETYEPVFQDELLMTRLKKLPHKKTWESVLTRSYSPVQEDPQEAPYYPMMALMLEPKEPYALPVNMVEDFEEHPENLIRKIADSWIEYGSIPNKIKCADTRTKLFFQDIAHKLNIKLVVESPLFALKEFEDSLQTFLVKDIGIDEDIFEEDASEEELHDYLDELINRFEEAMNSEDDDEDWLSGDDGENWYEDLDEDTKKLVDKNNKLLNLFEEDLRSKGLSEKTIRTHTENIDLFINDYLASRLGEKIEEGAYDIGSFLGDFFIRKCLWSTPASIKTFGAGIKKFYKCMYENGYVIKDIYDDVCSIIKEGMADWQEECKRYNDEDAFFW